MIDTYQYHSSPEKLHGLELNVTHFRKSNNYFYFTAVAVTFPNQCKIIRWDLR